MVAVPAQVLWRIPSVRSHDACPRKMPQISFVSSRTCRCVSDSTALVSSCCESSKSPATMFSRRSLFSCALFLTVSSNVGTCDPTLAAPSYGYKDYFDKFDGYTFKYPRNWIQVRGANADIFFRDPENLDENVSVEITSPSSSKFNSVEDLGPPEEAGKKVLKQYLTEFMSTRLGVRRESNVLSSSSRVADDGRMYYEIQVNVKSYANSNQLAVMPQDRIPQLEWDRRYLSVLGVENNCLYELRLQTPEKVFAQEENDLRQVMDSFRVVKISD
uniref:TSA: Wollemia nobilis Ref_Wollemi_Transcript_19328_1010 transcribed RNA sequence n=1 Tax=Wollemia nobilis TaxID=56998 RepID=A0A0C9S5G8_9CONI